jgi:hypothetical protein
MLRDITWLRWDIMTLAHYSDSAPLDGAGVEDHRATGPLLGWCDHALSPASRLRIRNFHFLIQQLRQRPMTVAQVANLLGFTISGARKYIGVLRYRKIVERRRIAADGSASLSGQALFALTTKPDVVDSFLLRLQQAITSAEECAQPRSCPRTIRGVTAPSHQHQHAPAKPAQRDPLVAALFGSGSPPSSA